MESEIGTVGEASKRKSFPVTESELRAMLDKSKLCSEKDEKLVDEIINTTLNELKKDYHEYNQTYIIQEALYKISREVNFISKDVKKSVVRAMEEIITRKCMKYNPMFHYTTLEMHIKGTNFEKEMHVINQIRKLNLLESSGKVLAVGAEFGNVEKWFCEKYLNAFDLIATDEKPFKRNDVMGYTALEAVKHFHYDVLLVFYPFEGAIGYSNVMYNLSPYCRHVIFFGNLSCGGDCDPEDKFLDSLYECTSRPKYVRNFWDEVLNPHDEGYLFGIKTNIGFYVGKTKSNKWQVTQTAVSSVKDALFSEMKRRNDDDEHLSDDDEMKRRIDDEHLSDLYEYMCTLFDEQEDSDDEISSSAS